MNALELVYVKIELAKKYNEMSVKTEIQQSQKCIKESHYKDSVESNYKLTGEFRAEYVFMYKYLFFVFRKYL